jgi:hypothetical protein
MTKWSILHYQFTKLSEKTGRDKSSSYGMHINFSHDGEVSVELGCYDIADWPRHLTLGPFKTEEEAYDATKKKVDEAAIVVNREYLEDQREHKEDWKCQE